MKWDNRDCNSSIVDYSHEQAWNDCVGRFAIAQMDFPEGIGIKGNGIEKVIQIKNDVVGRLPLWEIHPRSFRKIIHKLRVAYKKLKTSEKENGKIQ